MNRIEAIFADLRARGGKALMPFVTAGDPDLATTGSLLPAMEAAGASVCELGFPFSDPIADGAVIQESMTHALAQKVRPGLILEEVSRQRAKLKMGLVAMVSYSIVHRLGAGTFIKECGAAGIDGFIFPDLPVEEAGTVRDQVGKAGLICSFLIAPGTPPQRALTIARACSGFVYVLARAGVTGVRAELPPDLGDRLNRLREVTQLPLAVGFGVSTSAQVRQVVAVADAAIVGSAIVRRLAPFRGRNPGVLDDRQRAAAVAEAAGFVRELSTGLHP